MIKRNVSIMFSLIIILLSSLVSSEIEVTNYNSNNLIDRNSEYIIFNTYQIINDFEVTSSLSEINSCACSLVVDKIQIHNTGNVASYYTISTNDEIAKPGLTTVVVQPQQTIDVPILITSSCKKKSTNLDITVRSSFDKVKTLNKKINSDFCTSFAVSQINKENTFSNPCELQIFNFSIHNVGEFNDNFFIYSDKFEDDFTFSQNPVPVESKSSQDVIGYFRPECSIYGQQNISFKVQSEKTPLNSIIELKSNINRDYDFLVDLDQNLNQCNMELTNHPITIKNVGSVPNTYYLELEDDLKWAELSRETITLNPLEVTTINLILQPGLEQEQLENTLLKIQTELGDISKQFNISVNVDDCYSYEVSAISDKRERLCSDDGHIDFKIKNTGSKTNRITLYANTNKNVSVFSDSSITLESGEEDIVKVYFDDLEDQKQWFDINLNTETFSSDFIQNTAQKIVIEPINTCYSLKTNLKKTYDIKYNTNGNISLTLENTGFKFSNYSIKDNFYWINLDKSNYPLQPGEKITTSINYDLNDKITPGLHESNFEFNLNQAYMMRKVVNFNVYNLTMWELTKLKFKGFFEPLPTQPKIECKDVLSDWDCENRYFEFSESGILKIDLQEYFIDPDGDELSFGINETENLKVKMKGSVAHIKPKRNYFGISRIVFYAADSLETTYSDEFYIQVIDEPDNMVIVRLAEIVKRYAFSVSLSLLILIILISSLLYINKVKKDTIKENNKVLILKKNRRSSRSTKK